MRIIRIDDDVWKVLKRSAEAFVDTPNSVLRRVLKLEAPSGSENGATPRIADPRKGDANIVVLGEVPGDAKMRKQQRGILNAIKALGGKCTVQELTAKMPEFVQTVQEPHVLFAYYRKGLIKRGYITLQ